LSDNNIIIHESDEGILFYDVEKNGFYFTDNDANTGPIHLARQGFFDLTHEEYEAIGNWIRGMLNGLS
jgi:hypothetical protein